MSDTPRTSNSLLDDAQGLICGIVGWLNRQVITDPGARAVHAGLRQWLVTYADRASNEPEAIPRAWFRVHHTPDSVNGPAEADIDMAWGDQPDGDGWKPLYLRPTEPPAEPHVIKQIEHALQDNPAGASPEMAQYIRGCISDYRHSLTKAVDPDPEKSCLIGGAKHCSFFKKGHPCCDCGATAGKPEVQK